VDKVGMGECEMVEVWWRTHMKRREGLSAEE